MTNNADNVVAGVPLATGGVLIGPLATAAPTDSKTALAVGFVATGYLGDAGLVASANRTSTPIRAWGNDLVHMSQSDYTVTYKFSYLETTNTAVLKAVYGDNNVTVVAPTTSTGTYRTVSLNGDPLPKRSYVFEVKDGVNRKRIYVPVAQMTDMADVTYVDKDIVKYDVTLTAFKSATLGVYALEFTDDGVTV